MTRVDADLGQQRLVEPDVRVAAHAGHVGAVEVGGPKVDAVNDRARKAGVHEIARDHLGAAEVGHLEARASGDDAIELGVGEIALAEVGVVDGEGLLRRDRDFVEVSPVATVGMDEIQGLGFLTMEQTVNRMPQLRPDTTASTNQ